MTDKSGIERQNGNPADEIGWAAAVLQYENQLRSYELTQCSGGKRARYSNDVADVLGSGAVEACTLFLNQQKEAGIHALRLPMTYPTPEQSGFFSKVMNYVPKIERGYRIGGVEHKDKPLRYPGVTMPVFFTDVLYLCEGGSVKVIDRNGNVGRVPYKVPNREVVVGRFMRALLASDHTDPLQPARSFDYLQPDRLENVLDWNAALTRSRVE